MELDTQEARPQDGQAVRPSYRPLAEGEEAGVLVSKDGTRHPLWRALPEDCPKILSLIRSLPEQERREVCESLRLDESDLGRYLERIAEPSVGEAFFVQRSHGDERVIAFGAYRLLPEQDAAALTLAVAPDVRSLGIGSLLLERLAVLAARRGVGELLGAALPDNAPLLRLFRQAGLEFEERRDDGQVTFALSPRAPELRAQVNRIGARVFTAASLRPLFFPRSVAVVGASRDPTSVGHRILDGLIRADFNGPVYPVNPKASYVSSIKAYPSVESIGESVDLAVIAVPAGVVPSVVEECSQVGVRGLVVITAGFAEVGAEGRERQAALLEQVKSHGMRMVGPNCLGLIHTHPDVRLNASFAPDLPPEGSVALCSQSGALGIAIIALARRLDLGLSSFVSVGNKADVSGNDLLEYWEEDASTNVILFYLESFGDPRRFARLARRVGRSKPIVVVKAGRTEAGGRAAGSHTAALTVADTAVDALFRQTGIIRADTLVEMFGIARVLTDQPLPRGRRVAILTNAGGPAILCADTLEAAGLRVDPLSGETRGALAEFLPAAASTANPVDMIASARPDTYRQAVERLVASDDVDALVVIYTPVGMYSTTEVGAAVTEGWNAGREASGVNKPVLAAIVGDEGDTYALHAGDDERIPTFSFPEEMGRILGKITDYAEWRGSDPGYFNEFADQNLDDARNTCRQALEARGPGWLTVREARAVLDAAGLQVAPGGVAETAAEAVEIADEIGYPVAVKLASIQIVHKTEIGAVKLDLAGPEAVRAAFDEIASRLEDRGEREAMQGVLVQPMLEASAEVMIGVEQDRVFGPLIAFGLGGIHVEILRDVAFRVSPLTDRDAAAMMRQIKGFRLLEGYRGHPAADIHALEEALLRISRLVETVPEIAEMDLNPIFALPPGDGYRIVDARVGIANGE